MRSDPEYWNSRPAIRNLVVGAFLAPIAAAVNLQTTYMLVPFVCRAGSRILLHIVPMLALLVAGWGLFTAWRTWKMSGASWPDEQAGPLYRSRFGAMFGVLMSAASVLLIVMQWIPIVLMHPCTP